MTMQDAKRAVARMTAMDTLKDAGLSPEVLGEFERAQAAGDMVMGAVSTLMGIADTDAAKNYVQMQCVGLPLPFDRATIELVRPGGKTSHELKEDALGQLHTALILLLSVPQTPTIATFVRNVGAQNWPDSPAFAAAGNDKPPPAYSECIHPECDHMGTGECRNCPKLLRPEAK